MTHYLPNGHTIKDPKLSCEYTIKSVIGRGASTIAYLADYSDGSGLVSERILKEYYPYMLSVSRDDSGALICVENQMDKYRDRLARFKAGGETQNELRKCTGLVNETPPLQGIFEANNTCYFDVVPFAGRTFDKIETFSLPERLKICLAVAKVLKQYHNHGKLYLDLKPENIFVLTNADGEIVTDLVVLIDFDSVIDKDKVAFGNSLSFTKSWAAPEQINPHAFRKISEATDVYALGELVFWCVFGRHSTEEERRGFSSYPFDDTIRYTAQRKLSDLFHSTLRSSPRNRFSSLLPVVELLEQITEELTKKEFIIARDPVPKQFFLGRERELAVLHQAVHTDKVVFVTGLAGIGKSELVKWYVHKNRNQYDHILHLTYDGNLVAMVCDDASVSIANFARYPDEEDEVYASRKLTKLSSLLTPSSLIIIDNVDVLTSEFDSPATWSQIIALPGRIIVSSRCYEKEFTCVEISELNDIDLLRRLFLKYCPSAVEYDSQYTAIDRIISIAGKHTYEIELLAVYTEEKMQSPQETLIEMEQKGFSSLTGASLSVQKDGDYSGASFMEHLEKLLSMSKLSENQYQLLLKLSFMPAIGINLKDFKEFYGICKIEDLRWLIKHGLVIDTEDSDHILTVHPTITDVVINTAKMNSSSLESFYRDALTAMRRGYDDPSVNQSFYESVCQYLDSNAFFASLMTENNNIKSKEKSEEIINSLRENFASRYAKSNVSSAVYTQLCGAVADKTTAYKLQFECAAQYATQYVEWFAKYGHYKKHLATIQYALHIYRTLIGDRYYPDMEYAYAVYADLSIAQCSDYATVMDLCEKHLVRARKERDWHMASYWCTIRAKATFLACTTDRSVISYQVKSAYYSLRYMWQKPAVHDKFDNSFSPNTTKINIRSAELSESMYEIYPPSDSRIASVYLQMAIREREKASGRHTLTSPTNNDLMIAIDKARLSLLQLDFDRAKETLQTALEPYCSGQYPLLVATEYASELLADIYTITGNYNSAVDQYHMTLQIADSIGAKDTYKIRIKLGRAHNLAGSVTAKEFNYAVWEEIKDIPVDGLQRHVADAYYNVGDSHYMVGESNEAECFISDALLIYEAATHHHLHNNVGRARCNERLARINQARGNLSTANEHAAKAVGLLEEMLGSKHPEVMAFKELCEALQT